MLGLGNNQRGDTIVEVTIAVALLSIILAAAYTISGRAARLGQAAKERSQAVALVQQQAEIIESSAIRDWDSFIADYTPNGYYEVDTWKPKSGQFTDTDSGAQFQVGYTSRAICDAGICDADNTTKVEFRVTAQWTPVSGISSDSDDKESTTAIVYVSPSGVDR